VCDTFFRSAGLTLRPPPLGFFTVFLPRDHSTPIAHRCKRPFLLSLFQHASFSVVPRTVSSPVQHFPFFLTRISCRRAFCYPPCLPKPAAARVLHLLRVVVCNTCDYPLYSLMELLIPLGQERFPPFTLLTCRRSPPPLFLCLPLCHPSGCRLLFLPLRDQRSPSSYFSTRIRG